MHVYIYTHICFHCIYSYTYSCMYVISKKNTHIYIYTHLGTYLKNLRKHVCNCIHT